MKAFERLMEPAIAELSTELPAIAINGPKAVGKTWLAKRLARTVFEFDRRETRTLFEADRNTLLSAPPPVLIDEWQKVPETWEAVRRAVDEDASPGRFLLTGSAYPKEAAVHSGAGRIVHARLYPLSLQERWRTKPAVSLGDCLRGRRPEKLRVESAAGFEDYVRAMLESGFPGIFRASERARPTLIQGYIDNVLSKEAMDSGYRVRRPDSLLRWLRAFASATGTDASYTEILDSATPGERNKPSRTTTNAYRDMLANLWLLEELHPWLPLEGNFNRLKMTPKHYLADPAIEAALLGIDFDLIMSAGANTGFDDRFGSIAGRLFESLVALSLRTYAAVNGARLNFVKTLDAAHEVDFVLSRGARAVAVEVKLASAVDGRDARHLNWLENAYGKNLLAKIVVSTGNRAYVREQDGVIVCPAALLGA